jgi:hypothetical protein
MDNQNTVSYTAQQVFDIVLNGLRAQGKASVSEDDEYCLYRSADGCKCAAGMLIRDEDYEPTMELLSAPMVIEKFPALAHLAQHSRLIDCMQYAHDEHLSNKGIEAWETEMYNIARRYKLQYTRSISQPLMSVDPELPLLAPMAPGAAV